jgi:hypothetical protein
MGMCFMVNGTNSQQVNQRELPPAEELLPLVYQELRKLAAHKMDQEAHCQTLQPTALVHEAWLRLGADAQPPWQNRAHFFAAAAERYRPGLLAHLLLQARSRADGTPPPQARHDHAKSDYPMLEGACDCGHGGRGL